MDYGVKLFKYRSAGVREYWIVDPRKKTVMVYDLEKEEKTELYGFEEKIRSCLYEVRKNQMKEEDVDAKNVLQKSVQRQILRSIVPLDQSLL